MLDQRHLPMGLGMALAQNMEALQYFSSLSPQRQQQIVQKTHAIQSKEEMRQFVASLPEMQ